MGQDFWLKLSLQEAQKMWLQHLLSTASSATYRQIGHVRKSDYIYSINNIMRGVVGIL